jgi:hypothetical protein
VLVKSKAAEIVARYQAYFDGAVFWKDDAKANCCRMLHEIAVAERDHGKKKKEKFQEKADAFPHFDEQHKSEFKKWPEEAFDRLHEAFCKIFGIDDPLDDCTPPAAVLDARFRWVKGKRDIQFDFIDSVVPPLVLVTVYGP